MRHLPLACLVAMIASPAVAGPAEIAEVRAKEADFYRAFLEVDGDAMRAIFADDFAYQHGSGTTFDKTAFIDLVESEAVTVTRADAPDLTVRDFGDVIVTYGNGRVDGMVGSDPYAVDLRFVNVWHRVDDTWQLAHRNSELLPLDG